jgi:hypothetical protein
MRYSSICLPSVSTAFAWSGVAIRRNTTLLPRGLGAFVVSLLLLGPTPGLSAQAVLTRSYDNMRSGANTQEKNLTPGNVSALKKLRELTLDAGDDPRIEAQPLYVPQLHTANGQHDGAIICTMANNVYAFDVNTGTKLWKVSVGTPITPKIKGPTAFGQNQTDIDLWGINQRWGILSTPVIDIDTKTLYVVSILSMN